MKVTVLLGKKILLFFVF